MFAITLGTFAHCAFSQVVIPLPPDAYCDSQTLERLKPQAMLLCEEKVRNIEEVQDATCTEKWATAHGCFYDCVGNHKAESSTLHHNFGYKVKLMPHCLFNTVSVTKTIIYWRR